MQYAYDEDSLTGLDAAKRGSGAKGRRVPGGRQWTGDLRQRGQDGAGFTPGRVQNQQLQPQQRGGVGSGQLRWAGWGVRG